MSQNRKKSKVKIALKRGICVSTAFSVLFFNVVTTPIASAVPLQVVEGDTTDGGPSITPAPTGDLNVTNTEKQTVANPDQDLEPSAISSSEDDDPNITPEQVVYHLKQHTYCIGPPGSMAPCKLGYILADSNGNDIADTSSLNLPPNLSGSNTEPDLTTIGRIFRDIHDGRIEFRPDENGGAWWQVYPGHPEWPAQRITPDTDLKQYNVLQLLFDAEGQLIPNTIPGWTVEIDPGSQTGLPLFVSGTNNGTVPSEEEGSDLDIRQNNAGNVGNVESRDLTPTLTQDGNPQDTTVQEQEGTPMSCSPGACKADLRPVTPGKYQLKFWLNDTEGVPGTVNGITFDGMLDLTNPNAINAVMDLGGVTFNLNDGTSYTADLGVGTVKMLDGNFIVDFHLNWQEGQDPPSGSQVFVDLRRVDNTTQTPVTSVTIQPAMVWIDKDGDGHDDENVGDGPGSLGEMVAGTRDELEREFIDRLREWFPADYSQIEDLSLSFTGYDGEGGHYNQFPDHLADLKIMNGWVTVEARVTRPSGDQHKLSARIQVRPSESEADASGAPLVFDNERSGVKVTHNVDGTLTVKVDGSEILRGQATQEMKNRVAQALSQSGAASLSNPAFAASMMAWMMGNPQTQPAQTPPREMPVEVSENADGSNSSQLQSMDSQVTIPSSTGGIEDNDNQQNGRIAQPSAQQLTITSPQTPVQECVYHYNTRTLTGCIPATLSGVAEAGNNSEAQLISQALDGIRILGIKRVGIKDQAHVFISADAYVTPIKGAVSQETGNDSNSSDAATNPEDNSKVAPQASSGFAANQYTVHYHLDKGVELAVTTDSAHGSHSAVATYPTGRKRNFTDVQLIVKAAFSDDALTHLAYGLEASGHQVIGSYPGSLDATHPSEVVVYGILDEEPGRSNGTVSNGPGSENPTPAPAVGSATAPANVAQPLGIYSYAPAGNQRAGMDAPPSYLTGSYYSPLIYSPSYSASATASAATGSYGYSANAPYAVPGSNTTSGGLYVGAGDSASRIPTTFDPRTMAQPGTTSSTPQQGTMAYQPLIAPTSPTLIAAAIQPLLRNSAVTVDEFMKQLAQEAQPADDPVVVALAQRARDAGADSAQVDSILDAIRSGDINAIAALMQLVRLIQTPPPATADPDSALDPAPVVSAPAYSSPQG